MKIGLIDVDGAYKRNKAYPNLALMKLSSYFKSKQHNVFLIKKEWDSRKRKADCYFASKVFTESAEEAWIKNIPQEKIRRGGLGYGKDTILPEHIEHIMPDYQLYGTKYAHGFTTRGCFRNCGFCIVREKEGALRIVCEDIREFWNGQQGIIFMDNNIFGVPNHFMKVTSQVIKAGVPCDFNQGLDIRLLDNTLAERLSKMTPITTWKFAFDSIKYKNDFIKGAEILKKHKLTGKIQVFVLCGFDTTISEDAERFSIIKSYGFNSFPMIFGNGENIKGDIRDIIHIINARMPISIQHRYIACALKNNLPPSSPQLHVNLSQ